ncbi:MAG: serine/threonine protein kinase, partial [Clostridiales bacterium]|nr:serine/threonine protein kinase [Clostridiales bacterium]
MLNVPERLLSMQPLWSVWEIHSFIGEGSYGKVYNLHREEFGEEYFSALKWICLPQSPTEADRLRAEGLTEEEVLAYFENLVRSMNAEIRLMSDLGGNSHIVNYADHMVCKHEAGIGWDILIRMEFLTPLNVYIKNNPVSERDVAVIGIHICDALRLCARHKILHRDIKPDNIFISGDGNYKLGDFGVARTMEHTVDAMSRRGTPLYMAPEIWFGRQTDFSSDLYSLGLVMYVLLNNNRAPFLPIDGVSSHTQREEALTRRLKGHALPPPAFGSREMKKIVLKACAYKPAARYRRAEDMMEALEALLRGNRLSQSDMGVIWRGERSSTAGSSLLPPFSMSAAAGRKWVKILSFAGGTLLLGGLAFWLLMLKWQKTPPPPTGLPASPTPVETAAQREETLRIDGLIQSEGSLALSVTKPDGYENEPLSLAFCGQPVPAAMLSGDGGTAVLSVPLTELKSLQDFNARDGQHLSFAVRCGALQSPEARWIYLDTGDWAPVTNYDDMKGLSASDPCRVTIYWNDQWIGSLTLKEANVPSRAVLSRVNARPGDTIELEAAVPETG